MSQEILKFLNDREQFLQRLDDDLKKTDRLIDEASAVLTDLRITTDNVTTLSQKVEHEALIPLGRNIYVNGIITHTGEYFIDRLAHPNSYSTVETLERTLNLLNNKIKSQIEIVEQSRQNKTQIEERIILLRGDKTPLTSPNMPNEIVSDKGVAVRVGEFYEIVEFEN